jgi:membrane protein DedA with SNARE-associated domain
VRAATHPFVYMRMVDRQSEAYTSFHTLWPPLPGASGPPAHTHTAKKMRWAVVVVVAAAAALLESACAYTVRTACAAGHMTQ